MTTNFPDLSQPRKRIDPEDPLWPCALELHRRAIVIDTHSDLPLHILDHRADMGTQRPDGHGDLPRMSAGGLNVQFLAIYVSNSYAAKGALKRAVEMTEVTLAAIDRYADRIALATSPSQALALKRVGKIAAVLALEGGHALEGSLLALDFFHRLGFRYMTLTHIDNNELCDSSTDLPRWNGLSDFGKKVVQQMNRLGMMVDVSHISDAAFWQVLETSTAPVLATHSAARALADQPRNMDDEMIRALAEHGGTIQVCFGSSFLHPEWAARGRKILQEIRAQNISDLQYWYDRWDELQKTDPLPVPTIEDLVAHIDHVVQLTGPAHVGLGSDYDGVSHVPAGLDDVSLLPNITFALLKKGYSEGDIEKILGGNLLRIWQDVERIAACGLSLRA